MWSGDIQHPPAEYRQNLKDGLILQISKFLVGHLTHTVTLPFIFTDSLYLTIHKNTTLNLPSSFGHF